MKRIFASMTAAMLLMPMMACCAEGTSGTMSVAQARSAYNNAKKAETLSDYEEELQDMVEDGTLSREAADVLVKEYKAQQALASGVCPECGYDFSALGMYGRMTRGKRTGNAAGQTGEKTDLQSAQEAYQKARQAECLASYEEELKAMVEAGTLKQEEADLLIKHAKDVVALSNNTCPGCGEEIQAANAGMGRQKNMSQGNGKFNNRSNNRSNNGRMSGETKNGAGWGKGKRNN